MKKEKQLKTKKEEHMKWDKFSPPCFTSNLLQGLADEIAIKEQAKENLMFAVSEMNYGEKVKMSQGKDELILKCSFNQRDCNIER